MEFKMEEQMKEQEQRFLVALTAGEVEVVFRGLLELPSKFSLTVIQNMQAQLQPQVKKDEPIVTEAKDETGDKEGL